MWRRRKTVRDCKTVAVAISADDRESRWHILAELAQEEENPEKRFVILQELCTEFAALQKQLISAKMKTRKRHRGSTRRERPED
jgi:hypothetical protein